MGEVFKVTKQNKRESIMLVLAKGKNTCVVVELVNESMYEDECIKIRNYMANPNMMQYLFFGSFKDNAFLFELNYQELKEVKEAIAADVFGFDIDQEAEEPEEKEHEFKRYTDHEIEKHTVNELRMLFGREAALQFLKFLFVKQNLTDDYLEGEYTKILINEME